MPRHTAEPPGRWRRARYLIEARAFDLLSAIALRVPPPAARSLAGALGTLYWAVDARHRHVAAENVRHAYGDTMSPGDRARLVRASMQHFAQLTIGTLALDRYAAQPLESFVRVEGLDHLRAACDSGRGVIGITGHIGHWEMIPMLTARLGMPMTAVARPLDNPYLEARAVRLRTIAGGRVISRRGAFPEALGVLQAGGFLGLVVDQRPKHGGIVVPFFGRGAHTTDGIARLALASQATIIAAYAARDRDGMIRMVFEPPVPVARTGDAAADAYRITADCTAVIERFVRAYPEQWLWSHRRWAVPRFPRKPSAEQGVNHGA